jgi:hypothetical protein
MSIFDDASFSQSAAFGPQPRRRLEWDPRTMRWAPSELGEEDYNDKYAANIGRGAFKTFGTVAQDSPDTSTAGEREYLSPQGQPEFYKGSGGSLEALRAAIRKIQEQQAQQARTRTTSGEL